MATERLLSRGQNPRNEASVKPSLAQSSFQPVQGEEYSGGANKTVPRPGPGGWSLHREFESVRYGVSPGGLVAVS
jgi:hypothetical protein